MKYLVAGLGNIGTEYTNTRHNVGFKILDQIVHEAGISFEDKRYAFKTVFKYKARLFVLIKPTTYVNLSGKAVNYWLKKENIPDERLLVIVDDLSLPFGTLRLKAKGSDAGHNGLKSIEQVLGHNNYARLRFGIGMEDKQAINQVNYVLGQWTEGENDALPGRVEKCIEIIKGFGTLGIERTMNLYNNK